MQCTQAPRTWLKQHIDASTTIKSAKKTDSIPLLQQCDIFLGGCMYRAETWLHSRDLRTNHLLPNNTCFSLSQTHFSDIRDPQYCTMEHSNPPEQEAKCQEHHWNILYVYLHQKVSQASLVGHGNELHLHQEIQLRTKPQEQDWNWCGKHFAVTKY